MTGSVQWIFVSLFPEIFFGMIFFVLFLSCFLGWWKITTNHILTEKCCQSEGFFSKDLSSKCQAIGRLTGINADSDQFHIDFKEVDDCGRKSKIV